MSAGDLNHMKLVLAHGFSIEEAKNIPYTLLAWNKIKLKTSRTTSRHKNTA